MTIERSAVAARDLAGCRSMLALAKVSGPHGSASRPASFACEDGSTYWLKGAQGTTRTEGFGGLVAELVGGRLAHLLGAGPPVRVIEVPKEALAGVNGCDHLLGLCVGQREVPNAASSKDDIDPLLAAGRFDPQVVDGASRARVIALHTWLGSQDGDQVLVSLANGVVTAVDHAAAFANPKALTDPSLVVGRIDTVSADPCKAPHLIGPAIAAVSSVTDATILELITDMPVVDGDPWSSSVDNRVDIGNWLIHRRSRVAEVLTRWAGL